MAYSEHLADRIRLHLINIEHVVEKKMMGGLTFMVNEKMCLGIIKDELMLRIDPTEQESALSQPGCRIMDFTHRPMKGYVLVAEEGINTNKELATWINMALDFNPRAKSSKKK